MSGLEGDIKLGDAKEGLWGLTHNNIQGYDKKWREQTAPVRAWK